MVIAIDGYSSCGKSTLAKDLAKELGVLYVDSGAMYRGVTYYLLQNNIVINDEEVKKVLCNINLKFKNIDFYDYQLHLNGLNIESEIRSMEIAKSVSPVATLPSVRDRLVELQRDFANSQSVVMDGRDIGTVVFPNADLKIFVTADLQERSQRRYTELKSNGYDITLEEVSENLQERDIIDSTRSIAPLQQAEDARVLNNTYMTREQQLEEVLSWVEEIEK